MLAHRRNETSLIKKRLEIVFLGFMGVFLIIAGRLAYIQWFQSRQFTALANRMHGRVQEIDAKRGRILDRNGDPLAMDVLGKAVAINPQAFRDPVEAAAKIAALLSLDEAQHAAMRERIVRARKRKSYYCLLRRGVDRKVAEKTLALNEPRPAAPRIWLEDYPIRVNPGGRDGLQILGRVSADRRGIEAMELKLDRALRGQNGRRRIRVDATGNPIPNSELELQAPANGKDIRLTLDRDIQHFVEAELLKVAEEQTPDAATAIVMDVRSGDVLAMASWPTLDAAKPGAATPDQWRNRAITDLYEPGSIFKVITAAAALEQGVPTTVYCSGRRAIGRRSIGCAKGAVHGETDLRRMVEQSCNIAAGALAERVGPEKLYDFLKTFGLQSPTGIEFPGEEYARLPDPVKRPRDWPTMRTVNVGFGQGIQISPIQLLAAYSAIANDGLYQPPRLVLDSGSAGFPERQPRRVMSAQNAAELRSHMEAVCTDGTGKNAKIAGYSVGGKTGTAQIAKNGSYHGNGYMASFVGFLPVSKPRLSILVSVWHPRKGHYGGEVSAPVFREIARQSVAYLKVPPDAPGDPRDGADRATFARYTPPKSDTND